MTKLNAKTCRSADFNKLEEAIPLGYQATVELDEKLKKFSLSEAEYLRWMAYGSPLGPIYLGIGWSDDRSPIYFLRMGSVFGSRSVGSR